jgi:hypothetical protein
LRVISNQSETDSLVIVLIEHDIRANTSTFVQSKNRLLFFQVMGTRSSKRRERRPAWRFIFILAAVARTDDLIGKLFF